MRARARVIVDNDFSGDPDDLFQLAHHLLCSSVDIRGVIGSHLSVGDAFDPSVRQAENAVAVATDLLTRVGYEHVPIHLGSNVGLVDAGTASDTPGARAIIAEAMRSDVDTPLFIAMGGGMTELASAWLLEPAIADRLTLVWIGGGEHPGIAVPPPGAPALEYNLAIDPVAAHVIFTASTIPIWQVPRDAYRRCLVSRAELGRRLAGAGSLGPFLVEQIDALDRRADAAGFSLGDTYVLGDSPLVLLTALQTSFEPDPASSDYVAMPTPALDVDGTYRSREDSRPMRVYTHLDTRLMFEDMFARLNAFEG